MQIIKNSDQSVQFESEKISEIQEYLHSLLMIPGKFNAGVLDGYTVKTDKKNKTGARAWYYSHETF